MLQELNPDIAIYSNSEEDNIAVFEDDSNNDEE